jgi:hypothetical protein
MVEFGLPLQGKILLSMPPEGVALGYNGVRLSGGRVFVVRNTSTNSF